MDEREKALLDARTGGHPRVGWDRLRASAIGSLWGQSADATEISGAASWVLRAEASR
ncbi:MAG: hypothetical protein ACSLFA_19930 [Mycobacterium sp.]